MHDEHEAQQKILEEEVQEAQIKPVAGVWVCIHCGRRIQVITSSEHEKIQPFTCVCGNYMEPGPESAVQDELPEDD